LQPRIKTRIALKPASLNPRLITPTKVQSGGSTYSTPVTGIPFSVERAFFILRWLIIGIALIIQLYAAGNAKGPEQVVRALQLTALVAIYNGLFLAMRYQFTSPRSRVLISLLDAGVISLSIGLSGGIYSSFLVLIYLVVLEASFIYNASNALTFTAATGGMFVAATMFIGGQPWNELNLTIAMTEVMAMFIFVSVGSSMVKALEQQREVARREKEFSAQLNHQVKALSALNRLSERLNASLDLEELMQKTVEALPRALEVDACVAFLTERNQVDEWKVSTSWYGVDEAYEPMDNDNREGIQAGPLVLSQPELQAVVEQGEILRFSQEAGQEAVIVVPLRAGEQEFGALALLRQNGPAFNDSDQELLAALGRQMSLLIRNARLYELERQNVIRLQELEQLKSDFLSVVSHELRTPLTSIKASTILMLSQPLDEISDTEAKLLRNIDRNTDRLNGLVSDLLDVTKLQNGRIKLTLQPLNLAEVIQDVVASMRPLTDRRGQQLQVQLLTELSPLLADRRRLEQILTNLISNANRYTQQGGEIRVIVSYNQDSITVAISDNGPGIDSAEHELIFERFYRSTSSQASKTGTGLGLTIARSLVELHGGKIWVDSAPGKGSSFFFTLPAQTQASQSSERFLVGYKN